MSPPVADMVKGFVSTLFSKMLAFMYELTKVLDVFPFYFFYFFFYSSLPQLVGCNPKVDCRAVLIGFDWVVALQAINYFLNF